MAFTNKAVFDLMIVMLRGNSLHLSRKHQWKRRDKAVSKRTLFVLSFTLIFCMFLGVAASALEDAGWITVDVTSSEVDYYGKGATNWRKLNTQQAYNKVEISSDRDLHEVVFSFEGTAVRWLGSVGPMRGTGNVYIDDVLVGENVDLYREDADFQVVVFETTLDLGVHTIKIVPTGERNENSSFDAITVDAFQYLPSLQNKIDEAEGLLGQAPTADQVEKKLVSFYYPSEAMDSLASTISEARVALENFSPGEPGQIAALISLDEMVKDYENSRIIVPRPSLYSFEDALADSLGTFDATAVGTVTYVDGKVDKAANLDGNSHLLLPADHPIASSDEFTIAVWVNWREGNQWQRILDFGNNTSQYLFLTPNSGSNTLRFAITKGSGEQFIETSSLPKNEWVHVAVTLKRGDARLYVNGKLAASGNIDIVPSDFSPKNNYIAKSQWPDPLFNGMIDELYINNKVLTAEEIQDLMK